MMLRGNVSNRALAVAIALLVGAGVVGSTLFVLSGIYNVSAMRPHLEPVRWLIDVLRHRSVQIRSLGVPDRPDLDSPDLVMLGAAHYELGCASCHGAPGRPDNPVAMSMLPSPPDLEQASQNWTPAELFWIVRNGQKFTGMPGWPSYERADEVWAVVAFLLQLSGMDAAGYRRLAGLPIDGETSVGFVLGQPAGDALGVCIRCHGAVGIPPESAMVPALSGQSETYLARALGEYASGVRNSGIMQLAAAGLTEEEVRHVSAYYANGTPVRSAAASSGDAAQGQALAQGRADLQIPACLACHDGRASPAFPTLAGMSAPYIEGQLHLWQAGRRTNSAFGAIMRPIAQRLAPHQIADVAAFFQSLGREPPK